MDLPSELPGSVSGRSPWVDRLKRCKRQDVSSMQSKVFANVKRSVLGHAGNCKWKKSRLGKQCTGFWMLLLLLSSLLLFLVFILATFTHQLNKWLFIPNAQMSRWMLSVNQKRLEVGRYSAGCLLFFENMQMLCLLMPCYLLEYFKHSTFISTCVNMFQISKTKLKSNRLLDHDLIPLSQNLDVVDTCWKLYATNGLSSLVQATQWRTRTGAFESGSWCFMGGADLSGWFQAVQEMENIATCWDSRLYWC